MGEARDWFTDPSVARLRQALSLRQPTRLPLHDASQHAAVAVVLRPAAAGGMEVLLVRRAERANDPWSGHIALPGGRWQADDRSLEETAIRETREETAIDLVVHGEILGELDEIAPFMRVAPDLIIRPFVAAVHRDVSARGNVEIAEVLWTSLAILADPAATGDAEIMVRGSPRRERVFRIGEHIVWGLTERILRELLGVMNG